MSWLRYLVMETALQLLMRDGALRMSFHPKLNPDQYSALLASAEKATTRDELRKAVKALAKQWGSDVQFEL